MLPAMTDIVPPPGQTHRFELYGFWRSSSSYRVRFALGHKGLAVRTIPVNLLKGEHVSAEHRSRHPMGRVPCLLVDGRPFVESVAIIELLDELYPTPPLYPSDPLARADVRAMVETINSSTQPLQNTEVLTRLSKDPGVQKAWAAHFIARGLGAFEALLERAEVRGIEGPFAYGPTLTAADIFLVPQVYNARRYGVDLGPFERVMRAEHAAAATPAGLRAAPERQPDAPPSA